MIAQLISKKAGKWLEYEIGESPRKETALNPKHCIDIPYYILHTMRNYLLSILKRFEPLVTLRALANPLHLAGYTALSNDNLFPHSAKTAFRSYVAEQYRTPEHSNKHQ